MNDKSSSWEFEIRLVKREVTFISKGPEKPFVYSLKSLRTDGPQYNFMNYLLTHPEVNITRSDVQMYVDGCATVSDLTELVRYCGFNKQLKDYFFTACSVKRVNFSPIIQLDTGRGLALMNEINKIIKKS